MSAVTSTNKPKHKHLVAKLREIDKAKIKAGDKLMLLVSVGKENFNQEAMVAIATLLNDIHHNNPPIMIVVNIADSLQRFNMAGAGQDDLPGQHLNMSIASGDEWLKSVEPALAILRSSKHIIRWEYWRHHQDYEVARNKILKLEQDYPEEFKANMAASANEYVERRQRLLISEERFNPFQQKLREDCEQYLREEIICMVLWKETGCKFLLYPGRITPIMSMVLEKLIHPTNPELLQWLIVRLQRVFPNEAAIKAKHVFFMEKVIESTLGHIYWKDKHGVYLGCNDNQAKTLGYISNREIVGKTDFDLPWKEQATFLRGMDLHVMETKKVHVVEEPVFVNDHKEFRTFLSKKAPVEDDQGRSIGVVGISIDITDRKRAEQLQKEKDVAEKMAKIVQAISGCIAHEMRTPMSVVGINADNIKTAIQQLSANQKQKNNIQDMIKNIKFAVKSGSHIVNMLLAKLRRAFYNKEDIIEEFPVVSIKESIDAVVQEYPFYTEERNTVIWDNKAFEDFSFRGDLIAVKQILFNLIKNALHAIKEAGRGKIYITLKHNTKFNYLVFKDTALGISPQYINTIFEPFVKCTKSGTGLGLYFCKMSMNSWAGDITCSSEEGKYTEFTLCFPVILESVETVAAPSTQKNNVNE